MKIFTQLKFTFTFLDDPDDFKEEVVAEKMAEYLQNADGTALISKKQLKFAASDLGPDSRVVTIVVNNEIAPDVFRALKQMRQKSQSEDDEWNEENLGAKISHFYEVKSEKQEAAPGLYERLFETSFDDNLHFIAQIRKKMVRGFGGILVIIIVLSYLNFSMSGMCKKNGKEGISFSNKMMFNGFNVISLGIYGVFAYFTEGEPENQY